MSYALLRLLLGTYLIVFSTGSQAIPCPKWFKDLGKFHKITPARALVDFWNRPIGKLYKGRPNSEILGIQNSLTELLEWARVADRDENHVIALLEHQASLKEMTPEKFNEILAGFRVGIATHLNFVQTDRLFMFLGFMKAKGMSDASIANLEIRIFSDLVKNGFPEKASSMHSYLAVTLKELADRRYEQSSEDTRLLKYRKPDAAKREIDRLLGLYDGREIAALKKLRSSLAKKDFGRILFRPTVEGFPDYIRRFPKTQRWLGGAARVAMAPFFSLPSEISSYLLAQSQLSMTGPSILLSLLADGAYLYYLGGPLFDNSMNSMQHLIRRARGNSLSAEEVKKIIEARSSALDLNEFYQWNGESKDDVEADDRFLPNRDLEFLGLQDNEKTKTNRIKSNEHMHEQFIDFYKKGRTEYLKTHDSLEDHPLIAVYIESTKKDLKSEGSSVPKDSFKKLAKKIDEYFLQAHELDKAMWNFFIDARQKHLPNPKLAMSLSDDPRNLVVNQAIAEVKKVYMSSLDEIPWRHSDEETRRVLQRIMSIRFLDFDADPFIFSEKKKLEISPEELATELKSQLDTLIQQYR